MSSTVTELSPFERQLTVAVDGATLESAKNRAARQLSKDIRIKGFRPGKAPRAIVENTVGAERIKEEAIDQVLPEIVGDALRETELEPAVTPSVDAIRDTDDGVEVDVRVTLWPDVGSVPNYDGRTIEIEVPETTDEAIDEQIDRLRGQFAELETVERPSVDGDFVAINLTAMRDGEAIEALSLTDFMYEVGSSGLYEGLDASVIGRSAGDIEQFTTTIPEGFDADFSGQSVDMNVLVKEVKAKRLPELDDEFVSDYTEFDTVADLRGELENRMDQMRIAAIQQDFQSQLMFEMLDELEVEIPEAIITGQMDDLFHRFAHELEGSGIEFGQFLQMTGQTQETFLADLRDQAERSVRTDLLLDGIAAAANLEVTDEELSEAYEVLSTQVEESGEELAARLAGSVQEKQITGDILRRKALDALVRGAVAVDEDGTVLDLQLDAPPDNEQGDQSETGEDSDGGETNESAESAPADETVDADDASQDSADAADSNESQADESEESPEESD